MSKDPFTQALERRAKRGEIEVANFKGPKKPKKMLKRDWVGKTVRLKRGIQTKGGEEFKKGALMYVRGVYRGKFELSWSNQDPTKIRQVPEFDLEII